MTTTTSLCTADRWDQQKEALCLSLNARTNPCCCCNRTSEQISDSSQVTDREKEKKKQKRENRAAIKAARRCTDTAARAPDTLAQKRKKQNFRIAFFFYPSAQIFSFPFSFPFSARCRCRIAAWQFFFFSFLFILRLLSDQLSFFLSLLLFFTHWGTHCCTDNKSKSEKIFTFFFYPSVCYWERKFFFLSLILINYFI